QRELWEETGLFPDGLDVPLEGPVAIVDSLAPAGTGGRKHGVHVICAAEVPGSLEDVASPDDAVRGHRAFLMRELDAVPLHPPIGRFLPRWQPGDPAAYLGAM